MQEFSKKRLLRSKILAFIGCFGVLKDEIKKLDLYNHWARSRAPILCFASHMIMARKLSEFL
ncbi:hypothetical protein [Campylobacter concisus]|uniref:hypothetical protein n=1 Tax=Campylobacter concisus TaxID=199 RepID=UPI000D395363|nr:hypothetical protein [Campylobacter concisus]QPI04056.1 hypothetical protein G5B99_00610 [Campylobacter concisus]